MHCQCLDHLVVGLDAETIVADSRAATRGFSPHPAAPRLLLLHAGDAERLDDECGLPVADVVDLRNLAAERTRSCQLKQIRLAGLTTEIILADTRSTSIDVARDA
uniref:Uncharacterized protein n=1 Tax=Ananas comosus var. bracteatus TaxID=296719 RepID=A0A6V7NTQ8_ANACO|nr:unnamed protein product [Ananas comosus var. bracteatus]